MCCLPIVCLASLLQLRGAIPPKWHHAPGQVWVWWVHQLPGTSGRVGSRGESSLQLTATTATANTIATQQQLPLQQQLQTPCTTCNISISSNNFGDNTQGHPCNAPSSTATATLSALEPVTLNNLHSPLRPPSQTACCMLLCFPPLHAQHACIHVGRQHLCMWPALVTGVSHGCSVAAICLSSRGA